MMAKRQQSWVFLCIHVCECKPKETIHGLQIQNNNNTNMPIEAIHFGLDMKDSLQQSLSLIYVVNKPTGTVKG
jgi:hypothetical protein